MKTVVMLWCAASLVALSNAVILADGPNSAVAELKPLDRFAGRWTGTSDDLKQTSTSEFTWILDGRFLQQAYEFSDGSKGLIVRGYDSEARDYVMTLFDSRGITLVLRGLYDEATSTFTLTGLWGDKTAIWKGTFTEADTFESVLRLEDRNGQQLGEIKAKFERVGEKEVGIRS